MLTRQESLSALAGDEVVVPHRRQRDVYVLLGPRRKHFENSNSG
jgi:hypothetical protein